MCLQAVIQTPIMVLPFAPGGYALVKGKYQHSVTPWTFRVVGILPNHLRKHVPGYADSRCGMGFALAYYFRTHYSNPVPRILPPRTCLKILNLTHLHMAVIKRIILRWR